MNEILHQRIEEAAFQEGSMYDTIQEKNAAYSTGMKIATFALQNQWISVDEALPKEEKKVLVTHQYGFQVAAFYKDGAYSYWGVAKECPIGASITYWMPIPELKGGEE